MISVFFITLLSACNPESNTGPESQPDDDNIEVLKEKEEAIPQPEKRSVREIPRPRIHARHILVAHSTASGADPDLNRTKQEAEAIANQLVAQLKQGGDFPSLAKKYSDDASSKRGGDLGVFTKGIMHKSFEDATLALDIGAHSEVVETPFGFHIIERMPVVEVNVAHILVQWTGLRRTASERSREEAVLVAEQALAELDAGRRFDEVAKKYSDGPFGSRGGNLGWFQEGQMVPQFDDVAFALAPGATSRIVESANGFHIIHRIE